MIQLTSLPPLSLYLHLPWCVRKCPYCDFNSHEASDELPQQAYVDALLRDLEFHLPAIWGRRLHTVYLGGGTPSLFEPEMIDQLLAGVRARLTLAPDAEITLEANPGTVERERFHGFRAAGVNRLSLGIQSFNDQALRALGRIHGRSEALRAAEAALETGFDKVNLDIMFALPQQTRQQALDDVRTAIALAPKHVSLYQLTLEPNTYFYKYPPALPDHDQAWDIQQALQALLAEAGYAQYEISAYAVDAHQARHNLNYWQFGDYLGLGAGAHGKISDPSGITRYSKARQPRRYLETAGSAAGISEHHALTPKDAAFEFMLYAMRLRLGVPTPWFQQRTGQALALIQASLQRAEAQGLLHWDIDHLAPTSKGFHYLNDLLELFLPDDSGHAPELGRRAMGPAPGRQR